MQLRDAGASALDDRLGDHVEEAAHPGPTIRRLLSHSSGLQREVVGDVWETLESPTIEELLARLGEAEQVLEPGRWWHYSNLAFALLGEVVARKAGRPYREVVQERILDPLGPRPHDVGSGRAARPRLSRRALHGRRAARARRHGPARRGRGRSALVDDGRPLPLGRFPRPIRIRRCSPPRPSRRCTRFRS